LAVPAVAGDDTRFAWDFHEVPAVDRVRNWSRVDSVRNREENGAERREGRKECL
jgi:hypothetical protein